jgi:threonine dehydrogenase-like Zn-dependent dehydrogenase
MRQLTFVKPGLLEWWDVAEPRLQAGTDALVRPIAAARCDLDAGILFGMAPFKSRALHFLRARLPRTLGRDGLFRGLPFAGPFAFGHEAVAEVLEVGDAVKRVRPGLRVVVPFQISCGACAFCARGITASCSSVPRGSMYGLGDAGGAAWGGLLADCARVPFADHMLIPLPEGVDPAAVASADNIPDGYRTVAPHLAVRPGARVLVLGGGAPSIGLYAAGSALALGAGGVDYVDRDEARLAIARAIGATAIHSREWRRKERYPITVDASADPGWLERALRATEPGGVCTSVGIYFARRTPMPLLAMYVTGITFITSRVNASADLPAVLDLVQKRLLLPQAVTSRTAQWQDAPDALLDRGTKVVLTR